jgi:hypothetical protein
MNLSTAAKIDKSAITSELRIPLAKILKKACFDPFLGPPFSAFWPGRTGLSPNWPFFEPFFETPKIRTPKRGSKQPFLTPFWGI